MHSDCWRTAFQLVVVDPSRLLRSSVSMLARFMYVEFVGALPILVTRCAYVWLLLVTWRVFDMQAACVPQWLCVHAGTLCPVERGCCCLCRTALWMSFLWMSGRSSAAMHQAPMYLSVIRILLVAPPLRLLRPMSSKLGHWCRGCCCFGSVMTALQPCTIQQDFASFKVIQVRASGLLRGVNADQLKLTGHVSAVLAPRGRWVRRHAVSHHNCEVAPCAHCAHLVLAGQSMR